MEQVEVSVEDLLSGLKRKGIPLPFEIGAFIALEACEQIIDRPVRVGARDIGIGDIGEVLCAAQKAPVSEESAVRALMLLLSELLVCSAPGVPGMLLELVERGPSSGEWRLDQLRDDLEACLLPLNRGATRRVLSRLTREARKAAQERASRPSVVPAPSEIDAQFDALMGAEAEVSPLAAAAAPIPRAASAASASAFASPAPPSSPGRLASPAPRGSFAREDDATTMEFELAARGSRAPEAQAASLRALRTAAAVAAPVPVAAPRPASPAVRAPVVHDDELPVLETAEPRPSVSRSRRDREERARREEYARTEREPSGGSGAPLDDLLADMPEREGSRAPMLIGAAMVVAAVGLLGAYLALGQSGARRVLGLAPISDAPLPDPEAMAAAAKPAREAGELLISSQPGRAQVFLFIGNGPATATDLPMGVTQEFLALAEGYAPTRALVPADAQWEEVSGQPPRYELAMQATKSERMLELGASLLTRDVGTPSGRLGSVRVITTPKGAKVYQLIGFTPDVRVENLPLETGYELLVYLQGYGLQTRRVEPADFKPQDGKRVAQLDVPLTATRGR